MNKGRVLSVNISTRKGQIKQPVSECTLTSEGIEGDAHAGNWHRQVSLLAQESIDIMRASFPEIAPGDFAENITTEGILLSDLPIGTRLSVGQAVLELTQIGKECHSDCEIRRKVGDCVMPREGVFARVLQPGTVKPGDDIVVME